MKYSILFLALPILAFSECGKKKKITETDTGTTVVADTGIAKEPVNGNDTTKPKETIPTTGGKETTTTNDLPACFKKLIDEKSKETPPDGPTQIDEYLYNGKKVYLFSAMCCDKYNVLYDENCKELCAPSGGFTGRGDGKCPDFNKNAEHVKVVWRMK